MITLLEFAQRVRAKYAESYVDAEGKCHGGLCYATQEVSDGLYKPRDETGERLEFVLDRLIGNNCEYFGGNSQNLFLWEQDQSADRLACLDHIIKELEDESNQG